MLLRRRIGRRRVRCRAASSALRPTPARPAPCTTPLFRIIGKRNPIALRRQIDIHRTCRRPRYFSQAASVHADPPDGPAAVPVRVEDKRTAVGSELRHPVAAGVVREAAYGPVHRPDEEVLLLFADGVVRQLLAVRRHPARDADVVLRVEHDRVARAHRHWIERNRHRVDRRRRGT